MNTMTNILINGLNNKKHQYINIFFFNEDGKKTLIDQILKCHINGKVNDGVSITKFHM